jgi:hypothetical protein
MIVDSVRVLASEGIRVGSESGMGGFVSCVLGLGAGLSPASGPLLFVGSSDRRRDALERSSCA